MSRVAVDDASATFDKRKATDPDFRSAKWNEAARAHQLQKSELTLFRL